MSVSGLPRQQRNKSRPVPLRPRSFCNNLQSRVQIWIKFEIYTLPSQLHRTNNGMPDVFFFFLIFSRYRTKPCNKTRLVHYSKPSGISLVGTGIVFRTRWFTAHDDNVSYNTIDFRRPAASSPNTCTSRPRTLLPRPPSILVANTALLALRVSDNRIEI